MGCYWFFFSFTERLTDRYPNLFTGEFEEGEDTKSRDYSGVGNFNQKWSGYHSIAVLANNDVTKFDQITEMNIHKCLTYLVYIGDLNKYQEVMMKQSQVLK
jgi:hypothetical protein